MSPSPFRLRARALARASLAALVLATGAHAQVLPDDHLPVLNPELLAFVCLERTWDTPPTAERIARAAEREPYRRLLPEYLARLPLEPDAVLLMPVDGVRVAQVADTWGALRGGGRHHEGQDVFAARGTPIRSATHGIVYEVSDRFTGGRGVMVLGAGGVRYFYTHLDTYAEGLREGMAVSPDTILGTVGTAGNAVGTPPHLHFGAYAFDASTCRHRAFDPLPTLIDRTQEAVR